MSLRLTRIMVAARPDHIIGPEDSIDLPVPGFPGRPESFRAPHTAANVPDAVGKEAREFIEAGALVTTGVMMWLRRAHGTEQIVGRYPAVTRWTPLVTELLDGEIDAPRDWDFEGTMDRFLNECARDIADGSAASLLFVRNLGDTEPSEQLGETIWVSVWRCGYVAQFLTPPRQIGARVERRSQLLCS